MNTFFVRRPYLDRIYRTDILINELASLAVLTKNNTVQKHTHMKPKLYQHFIDKNPNNYIDKTQSNSIFGGIPENLSNLTKKAGCTDFLCERV